MLGASVANGFASESRNHPALRSSTSIFKRNWLGELALAAIAVIATRADSSPRQAIEEFAREDLAQSLDSILTTVFQSLDPTEVTGAEAAGDGSV